MIYKIKSPIGKIDEIIKCIPLIKYDSQFGHLKYEKYLGSQLDLEKRLVV